MSEPVLFPLSPDQQQLANQLAANVSPEQATWLSGFFAGLGRSSGGVGPAAVTAAPAAKTELTVLYGSESGNAEKLSADVVKAAGKRGFKAKAVNMADAKAAALSKAENLLVVVSTWGEGDPPDAATSYYEEFMADAMPKLAGLKFSVCALGDTSYEHFCKIGKDFDSRLAALGGERVHDRVDCDVDFEAPFKAWLDGALAAFPTGGGVAAVSSPATAVAPAVVAYDKKNPYSSELLEKVVLNGTGSGKETLHVELSLEGSGLSYEPGDALGIYPENRAADVEAILAATGLSANEKCGDKTLAEALKTDFDITALSPAIALKYNGIVGDAALTKAMAEKADFKEWIWGRQLVDLIETYPNKNWDAQIFTGLLRPLAPRLYSIASSLQAHPDEVHLTIAAVRYDAHGRDRVGVCSTYVSDLLSIGDHARVYFHSNNKFRLPESDDTPIIMVGPGTGIAPFRAFIEERTAREAKGKNWLFFGDQHFSYDFLYQLEWLDYLEDGILSELTTAFSRDQKDKVYVQHRMMERAVDIWEWLEEGAHFYVCGDASRMAKDVHQALLDIAVEQGGKSPDDAKTWLNDLRKAGRYQRDVY